MKSTNQTKEHRNFLILLEAFEGLYYTDIAKQFGISTTRVRQIVNRYLKSAYVYRIEDINNSDMSVFEKKTMINRLFHRSFYLCDSHRFIPIIQTKLDGAQYA